MNTNIERCEKNHTGFYLQAECLNQQGETLECVLGDNRSSTDLEPQYCWTYSNPILFGSLEEAQEKIAHAVEFSGFDTKYDGGKISIMFLTKKVEIVTYTTQKTIYIHK